MSQKDELFELVRGLSPSERRYVTQFCSAFGDEPLYLKLFDALCSEKEYEEAAFKEKHADKDFVSRLPSHKNQLKGRILDALRERRKKNRTAEFQVAEMIENSDIYKGRGFAEPALSLLEKAEKRAKTLELFEYSILILKKQRDLLVNLNDPKARIDNNFRKIGHYIHLIGVRQKYLSLKDKLFLIVRENAVLAEPQKIETLNSIMADPLLQNENQAKGFDALNYFLYSHSLHYQLTGNLQSCWVWQRKLLGHWMKHPEIRKDRPGLFANLLNNFLGIANKLDSDEDFLKYLDVLKLIKQGNDGDRNNQKLNILVNELQYQIRQADWEGAIASQVEFEKLQSNGSVEIPQSRLFAFNTMLAYLGFILEKYDDAQNQIDKIKKLRSFESRKDLHLFAYLFRILIFYETEGEVENELRSAKRQVEKSKEIWNWQRELLNLFSSLKNANPDQKKKLFINSEKAIKGMSENDSPGYWMVFKWLKSKNNDLSVKQWIEKNAAKSG